MKARLFWHVFCAAHWFDICNEIMRSLYCSKFPFAIEAHIIGTEGDCTDFCELAGIWGLPVQVIRHDKNTYEYWTIAAMYEYAKWNKGLVCYIHNKGTTSASPTYSKWRWCMLQKIVVEWKDRVADFAACDLDAVGCFLLEYWPCFAGNWWWATTDFIRQHEPSCVTNDRFYYEKWLLSGKKVRLLSLLATNLEPYLHVTHIRLGNPHRAYVIWEKTRAKITDD